MQSNPRFFTLEEAHELIPAIEKVLKRLDAKVKVSEKLHDHLLMEELLHEATGSTNETLVQEDQKRLDQSVESLAEEIQEINSLGCKVCNLARGWIDFPAKRLGTPVFYVWKRGDEQIRFYRGTQDKNLLPL